MTVDKQAVKDAPSVDADQQLSEAEERQLFEHYGVPYTTEGSTTAQGVAGAGDTRPRPAPARRARSDTTSPAPPPMTR